MKNGIAVVKDTRAPAATILGRQSARIPTAGKIRSGIKVLTRRAQENARAREIYEAGVAAGQSFDDIERTLAKALPDLQYPMVPKNVPYFTVRSADFPNPATAQAILDLYGEDRGDGVRRLYRFPVIFPADAWQAVMPHQLVTWGANERKYWSEYAPDGKVRLCKCYAPVPIDRTASRPVRIFGGRKTQLRAENNGMCDPENCPEFQARKCNLSGRFLFYIPGVKSSDAFELRTNSMYSMMRAIEKFETLAFMRGGRISGFLDEKRTPFYITKVEREIPHVGDDGRTVRSMAWLIELEAPIDVAALLNVSDAEVIPESEVIPLPAPEGDVSSLAPGIRDGSDSAPMASARNDVSQNANRKGWQRSTSASQATADASRDGGDDSHVADIFAVADAFGVDKDRFEAYAAKKWGAGWIRNAGGRVRVLNSLEGFGDDPEALHAEIDRVLGPVADLDNQ
ncbi:hypothetical protein GJ700_02605 [Duganella sp. FT92W]|uniref:Uncharacterized protein n=1 Tax=Pseudoduganella rivuli TaxID=2666085 RepID=A0A7X2IIT0_9BURK|nr:hypothetical protein [Pseudoduganella rivuli]MRV70610.1 hypothetical protein [Pseudoduganella rivuli]